MSNRPQAWRESRLFYSASACWIEPGCSSQKTTFLGEGRQTITQDCASARDAGFYGADRYVQDPRNLLVAQLFHVDEQNRFAELGRQSGERCFDFTLHPLAGKQRLRIRPGRIDAQAFRFQFALELAFGRDRLLARRFAIAVAKVVEENCEHPGTAIGPGLELVKEAVSAKDGFLEQISRVVGIARQAHRHRVERVEMRQGLLLESLAPVCAGAAFIRHMRSSKT